MSERLKTLLQEQASQHSEVDSQVTSVDNQTDQTVEQNIEPSNVDNEVAPQVNSTQEVDSQVNIAPVDNRNGSKNEDVFASEEVARINNFLKKNPSKNVNDFYELTKDINSIPEDDLIRQYLSEKEGKQKAGIELEMKRMTLEQVPEMSDEDFDDDFGGVSQKDIDQINERNLEKQAKREELLAKAKAFHTEKVNSELSFESNSQPDNKLSNDDLVKQQQAYAQEVRANYLNEIYKVEKEVSDIPLNIGGKTVFFTMEDEVKSSIRPYVENISETVKDYFNADYTQVTNAKSLYEDFAAWRSPQFKQQVFDFIYEQGVAAGMEQRDKAQRNISFNNREVTTQNSNPREELEGLRHGANKSILK
ncbi:hypothetical protein HZP59_08965 [Elizabethkingia anophelis]|nr:hypothetical protein [Elizabethkingia anophelis]